MIIAEEYNDKQIYMKFYDHQQKEGLYNGKNHLCTGEKEYIRRDFH